MGATLPEGAGPRALLIVDDEAQILSALKRALRRESFDVLTAGSPDEALRVVTIHGAHASFEEKIKGSISPGKLADLVVLAKDPTDVDPFELIDISVERTMVGGRWVYES